MSAERALGSVVDAAELADITVPDGCVVIWGEDWSGNRVMRGLRPGYTTTLRGEFGHGFDTDGPHATLCSECGVVLVTPGPMYPGEIQKHVWDAHGKSLPMLP